MNRHMQSAVHYCIVTAKATLGACSALSFLTSSPCWETRVCGQEDESVSAEGGAGVDAGGVMPGLYSIPVSCLN